MRICLICFTCSPPYPTLPLLAFDPADYASSASSYDYGHKNRMVTVFWYLSDVTEGGHTAFPRAGAPAGLAPPTTNKGCNPQDWSGPGLLVKPEKGKVIIFYSLYPNGEIDEHSLHGGCPVRNGIKWSANKWVWNKPSGYYSGASIPNDAFEPEEGMEPESEL